VRDEDGFWTFGILIFEDQTSILDSMVLETYFEVPLLAVV